MGAGGIIIIRKNIKAALGLSLNQSSSVKVWHGLIGTHGLVLLLGWLI